MAITDIAEYAHLTDADIEALGAELDALRREIEESRGEEDAKYIRRVIKSQRIAETAGRVFGLGAGMKGWKGKAAWAASAACLSYAKVIENNELGHNIMHGQWDWMNDPEIHSTNWEWDSASDGKFWRHTHNYMHHKYTNVTDMDDDIGYGILRVTRDQPWEPYMLFNPIYNFTLMIGFQYGKAVQHLELMNAMKAALNGGEQYANYDWEEFRSRLKVVLTKIAKQTAKDYVLFPAMAVPFTGARGYKKAASANYVANTVRDVWDHMTIFCGHFPDDAEKFTIEDIENETLPEWYLRQMLGTANFEGSDALHFITGHLGRQIEHHLYPDLPSNRYNYINSRLVEICEKYDLPYNTGPMWKQYAESWRTIIKLSLPDKYLKATVDDAPETHSNKRFYDENGKTTVVKGEIDADGNRRGLRSHVEELAAAK